MPPNVPERYRLYIDESGDHVFRQTEEIGHRYLCLSGCWFRTGDYLTFHQQLEALKAEYFPHHPDNPVIFHREDMVNARGPFKVLQDLHARQAFNDSLRATLAASEFRIVTVVIDKKALREHYGAAAAHPYHLGLGFMLQRYAGFLNHINRRGDVMAESRGGREDRLLKESYARVYSRGAWMVRPTVFQTALTSRELKLKPKSANVAGLQLADMLGHPLKQWILRERGRLPTPLPPFPAALVEIIQLKLNRHLYDGHVEGYGVVFFPKE